MTFPCYFRFPVCAFKINRIDKRIFYILSELRNSRDSLIEFLLNLLSLPCCTPYDFSDFSVTCTI
nr:MAG TPA: hypothetical protein [Caudoviricetes sp.]